MIVKHRRGTTQEWKELDLVLEEGELALEECSNGLIRGKFGTADRKKFSELPYIDDEVLKELATFKAETTTELANLEKSLSTDISDINQALSSTITEVANQAAIAHETLASSVATTEARLTNSLAALQLTLESSIAAESAERTAADLAMTEAFGAHVENYNKNLVELNKADLANEKVITTLTAELGTKINELQKTDETLQQGISSTDAAIKATAASFDNKLTEATSGLTDAIEALEKRLTGEGGDEGSSSGSSTNIAAINAKLSYLGDDIKELSSEIDSLESELSNSTSTLAAAIEELDKQINGVPEEDEAGPDSLPGEEGSDASEPKKSLVDRLDALQEIEQQLSTEMVAVNTEIDDLTTAVNRLSMSTTAKITELENTLANSQIADGLRYENSELWLTYKGGQVGNSVTITGGTAVGGSYSTVTVTPNSPSTVFTVAKGTEAWVAFTYTSFRNEVQTSGDGTCSVKINDENIAELFCRIQHGVSKPLEVSKYLTKNKNTVEITCTDRYGTSEPLIFTISVVSLSVDLDPAFNEKQLFEKDLVLPYVLTGTIQKKLHILITDEEGKDYYNSSTEYAAAFHNAGDTKTIDLQACGCTHGIYKVKLFLSATLENGDDITSDPVEFNLIYTEPDKTAPLLAVFYSNSKATQGDELLIPFILYDPTKSGIERDTDVKVTIYSKVNGQLAEYTPATKEMSTISGRVEYWMAKDYPPGTTVFEISYAYSYLGETRTIKKSVELSVSEVNLNIQPITNNLQLYLTAQGRANSDKVLDQWTYGDITTTFSNFNWKSNGWDPEDSGESILRLNGDAKAIINFKPFATDAKSLGRTIEFDFLVRDVNDRDAVVIDCTDNEGRGFRATSDTAYLQSRDTKVSCRYKDLERVHIVITIEPSSTSTRFVSIYLDGILSGVQSYSTEDIFSQINGMPITLGSTECGLDVYSIRVYNRALSTNEVLKNYIAQASTIDLKKQLIKENYFGEPDELGNIYNYRVSYEEAKRLKNIPIVTFTGAMPAFKGDKKKKSVYFKLEDPTNTTPTADDLCYYAQDNGGKGILLDELDVQGTSSAGYVRKNWKLKLPTKLRHIKDAIKTKTFCLKVDYAEATGTHNTGTANYVETLYDKTILNAGTADEIFGEGFIPPQKTNDKIRTTIQGFPCLIFERADDKSEYVFSSKGNFNYDKGSKETFGFTDQYEEFGPESWEFCNNTSGACNFLTELPADWREDFEPRYTSKLSSTFDDKEGEFINAWDRIEKLREKETAPGSSLTGPEQEELESLHESTIVDFKAVHDWVVSTATKEPIWGLDEDGNEVVIGSQDIDFTNAEEFKTPVTIAGETFTKDSKQYRLARFKHEFENYFNLHYTLIYYVFTFFALMVDQRAKNLFLTYWANTTDEITKSENNTWCINSFDTGITVQNIPKLDAVGNPELDTDGNEVLVENFPYTYAMCYAIDYVDSASGERKRYCSNITAGRWYPYFYDNDTIFGINNVGALTFDYYHEDSGELGTIGTMNVYNGQNSVLWNNFRESFALEIQQTYQNLRNNDKLTYDKLINCYITEGSDKWSAAVYNEDAEYKYISMARPYKNDKGEWVSDKGNLRQVRGPAEHHLRYFLDARLKYCDSKWYAGDYPYSENMITLRLNPVETIEALDSDNLTEEEISALTARSLSITPYSTMHVGVRFKSGTLRQALVMAGDTHDFTFSEYSNDTETYLYGAENLSSIGSIAHYKCSYLKLEAASKLTELKIGHRASNYDNPNLAGVEIGSKRLLRTIDLRNCSGLGIKEENGKVQRNLDLSGCPNIEHIYTEGTNLASVTLPDGGHVRTLHLPASTDSITIKNQKYLQDSNFDVASYANVGQIIIENCPLLDVKKLFTNCGGGSRILRVRLTGITYNYDKNTGLGSGWCFENASFIKGLIPVRDSSTGNLISGIVDPDDPSKNATLSGTCYIKTLSSEDYALIKENYPALNIDFGEMTSTVTFEYYDENGIKQEKLVPIAGQDSAAGEITAEQLATLNINPIWPENIAFDYRFMGWSEISQTLIRDDFNDDTYERDSRYEQDDYLKDTYPDLFNGSSLNGIIGDRTLYPVFKATRKSFKVTFINPTAPINEQILHEVYVPYGETAEYPYADPIKQNSQSPGMYYFIGWLPATENITAATACYAQFTVDYSELEDADGENDWYVIATTDLVDTSTSDKGYKLNSNGTASITKCYNDLNPAVIISDTLSEDNITDYTVTSVGGFGNLDGIEILRLPNTLKVLSSRAFEGCDGLMTLTLPDTLTEIGANAFHSCLRLNNLVIPKDVNNIGYAAFAECPSLSRLEVSPENKSFTMVTGCLIKIDTETLIQAISGAEIPDSVTSLQSYCFAGVKVTAVKIPNGVTTIPSFAFKDCSALNQLTLHDNITLLDSSCFTGCKSLKTIQLPSKLYTVRSSVFYNCSFETLTIPASLLTIGATAFGGLSKLKAVTFETSIESFDSLNIDSSAFNNSGTDEETLHFYLPWTAAQHSKKWGANTAWGAKNYELHFKEED